jgi:hydroxyacylglutathione hydrolase
VLLADDDGRIQRARMALRLIGLDRVTAFAGAGVRREWADRVGALQTVDQVDVQTLAGTNHRTVVDVRRATEWRDGHLPIATHIFLGDLVERTRDLPRDTPIALHCQGGTRSAIAASVLQAEGFTNVANVTGGFRAWERAGLPVVAGEAQS